MQLTMCLVFVAACASLPERSVTDGASTAHAPSPNHVQPARVSESLADGGEAILGPESTTPTFVLWTEANTCSFPAVSPAAGTTAKQCCIPVRDLELCLETMSTIHHHQVGPYTQRTLTAIRRSDETIIVRFPLDRHHHRSMKYRDTASVLLALRVQESGLELSLRYGAGCNASCIAANECKGEAQRVAEICESVGAYVWDGQQLVRIPVTE